MSRRFDVVLFGPTGVTGREVARYLARRAPETGRTWAVAGRDRARIESALAEVGVEPPEILHADAADPESINDMVGATSVVANLVGPYAAYGEPVYAACARYGTAEVDLTGELDWVLDMLGHYGYQAEASGARIVPTAGFEALPFDLLTLLAAREAASRFGEPVVDVDCAAVMHRAGPVSRAADAVSGGTFGSLVGMIRRGPGEVVRNPYLLDPPAPAGAARRPAYELRPRRHAGTGEWLAPMIPAPFLNPPVVHRSAALLRARGDHTFSYSFRYHEGIAVGTSLPRSLQALAPGVAALVSGLQWGFSASARSPEVARGRIADVLERVGPGPKEGPKPETLDDWEWHIEARATTSGGDTVDAVVEGLGNPGYKTTATMVGEAALILADPDAPTPRRSGFLTPATALGLDVLDRFPAAGLTFRVVD